MTAGLQGPTVLTVLLNWRTAKAECDRRQRRTRDGGDCRGSVVVDNDSGDGSFERMSGEHCATVPRFRVVQSGRNGGFGAGNNVGIRLGLADGSRPDYVYILNSDAFPAPDASPPAAGLS